MTSNKVDNQSFIPGRGKSCFIYRHV